MFVWDFRAVIKFGLFFPYDSKLVIELDRGIMQYVLSKQTEEL